MSLKLSTYLCYSVNINPSSKILVFKAFGDYWLCTGVNFTNSRCNCRDLLTENWAPPQRVALRPISANLSRVPPHSWHAENSGQPIWSVPRPSSRHPSARRRALDTWTRPPGLLGCCSCVEKKSEKKFVRVELINWEKNRLKIGWISSVARQISDKSLDFVSCISS